jgi:hypothetical protein
MKYLSVYLVALALAFSAVALASIDAQAAVRCGPKGCYHYYPHRSQGPVGGAQLRPGSVWHFKRQPQ